MQVAHSARSYNGRMPKVKRKVAPMAFRFTEDAAWILEECSRVSGKSKAAILEELIRAEARKIGVSLKNKPAQNPGEPAKPAVVADVMGRLGESEG